MSDTRPIVDVLAEVLESTEYARAIYPSSAADCEDRLCTILVEDMSDEMREHETESDRARDAVKVAVAWLIAAREEEAETKDEEQGR